MPAAIWLSYVLVDGFSAKLSAFPAPLKSNESKSDAMTKLGIGVGGIGNNLLLVSRGTRYLRVPSFRVMSQLSRCGRKKSAFSIRMPF
jgi:hypothetical protein